jgi:hypothetical protein
VLGAICTADLVSTLMLVSAGHAGEQNPLLAYYLHIHPVCFALAKMAYYVLPLVGLEILARHRPRFTRVCLGLGAVAYVAIYAWGTAAQFM